MGKLVHPLAAGSGSVPLGVQGSRMLVGASWNCWGWGSPDLRTATLPGLSAPCSLAGWNQSAGGRGVSRARLFPRL